MKAPGSRAPGWRGRAPLLGVLGLAALVGLGPSHGRTQEASKRLAEIRAEIEAREAKAREYGRNADSMLAQLEALDMQIFEVRNSQQKLTTREREAVQELEVARKGAAEASAQMERSEHELAPRLVALYKFSATGGLPALYSERDFQSSLRLRDGLSKVLAADVRVFSRYRDERREWQSRTERAESLVQEITLTREEIGSRKNERRQLLVDKRNFVELWRQRATRETRAAVELREAATRLQESLVKLPGPQASGGEGLVKGALLLPVQGKIRLPFGTQTDPQFQTRIRSGGIEFDAQQSTDVHAVAAGRVVYAGWFRGYGQVVIIDHGQDSLTVSGYLDELAVGVDDRVTRGQVIGKVGETGSFSGPGLYFELRRSGKAIDPRPWFEPGTEGKL